MISSSGHEYQVCREAGEAHVCNAGGFYCASICVSWRASALGSLFGYQSCHGSCDGRSKCYADIRACSELDASDSSFSSGSRLSVGARRCIRRKSWGGPFSKGAHIRRSIFVFHLSNFRVFARSILLLSEQCASRFLEVWYPCATSDTELSREYTPYERQLLRLTNRLNKAMPFVSSDGRSSNTDDLYLVACA